MFYGYFVGFQRSVAPYEAVECVEAVDALLMNMLVGKAIPTAAVFGNWRPRISR